MANEITFSSLGDLTTSERLAGIHLLLLADRTALPQHPAIIYAGSVTGSGSNVIKVPHAGLFSYDLLAVTSEGSQVSNTALTDSSTQITVARYSKVYQPGDTARIVDATGLINLDTFAMDAIVSQASTMLNLAANVVDDFTAYQGTSGQDATFANFLDAITTLETASAVGPLMGLLHSIQWGDIRKDVASASGGAIQWNQGSQAMINAMKGLGYQGEFCGVSVYTSNRVPTANSAADRAGAIWAPGGLVWADANVPYDGDPNAYVLLNGKVLFERARSATYGLTGYVSHAYMGVAKAIDAAGCAIITDA